MTKNSRYHALAAMAMMSTIAPFYGDYGPRHKPEPHYFNYSGIPTEEQLRKREERKARKKAKKRKER